MLQHPNELRFYFQLHLRFNLSLPEAWQLFVPIPSPPLSWMASVRIMPRVQKAKASCKQKMLASAPGSLLC